MTTSIILSIIIIIIIMLSMAGLSELTYQFFGKGKKLKLGIHSDDDFEKALTIEGGDKLLNTLRTKGTISHQAVAETLPAVNARLSYIPIWDHIRRQKHLFLIVSHEKRPGNFLRKE